MLNEKEGVKAIIALQKLLGVKEPEAIARKNWNGFSEAQKIAAEIAYKIVMKEQS